jgi:integrase
LDGLTVVKKSEAKQLTDAAVSKYQPTAKRRRIKDALAKSLYLVIEPSGHKSWQMRFRRPDGKPGKITLGPVDFSGRELKDEPEIGQPLTLESARLLAAAVHRKRKLGQDPIGDNKARRHRQRVEIEERKASTFGTAVRDYIKEYARPKTRNWRETARVLGLLYPKNGDDPVEIKGGLAQRWGAKSAREIDGHDIWSVIEEARRIAIPGIVARNKGLSEARARGLSAALSSLFGWLARHRRVDINPCSNVHRPPPPDARDRVLTTDEIRWFWQACESADAPLQPRALRPFAPLLRCLLLSGQRRDEVANMTRTELGEDGVWRLPGERTKNGRAHIVPLPPLALELIASVGGTDKFIFTTTGTTPVSGWSRVKHRLDEAMLALAREERGPDVTIPPWRLHDLRRTAVTGMAELGIQPHVIEFVVNHVSGTRGGIAGVYNRSELMSERRTALERWSTHLQGLVDGKPNTIIPLRTREK